MTKVSNIRALRLRRLVIDLSIMTVIGAVLALIGPFGSINETLAIRLVYWIGLCWAGFVFYGPISSAVLHYGMKLDLPQWGLWVGACMLATIPMTMLVWALGFMGRDFRMPGAQEALFTYFNVLVIGAGITAIFRLVERANSNRGDPAEPIAARGPAELSPRFMDRLPPALGSELIALEMEDHYVRAHTALGSELVLLRMRDAVAELDGAEGMQVHRSWWVARDAVEDVRREGRNIRLGLTGGLEAPVSRANVQSLKDAGWI